MGLIEYRRKRNFRVTAEPRGGRVAVHKKLSFVIQKHAASHLHYDFRLELDGVLKSWAVPKGPSLDPATKRLAMHVEDHPLEYGDFEGIIPAGEYGGGTVLLWDRGTWEPVGDGEKGYRDGSLKFVLHGEKLQGGWMLVRRGGRRGDPNERHWFLFKERDESADPDVEITAEQPLSVATGRDLDEIAEEADRVWGPNGEAPKRRRAKGKRATSRNRSVGAAKDKTPSHASQNGRRPRTKATKKVSARTRQRATATRAKLKQALKRLKAKRAPLPGKAEVQLATLAKDVPAGDDWMHEIKLDGYRMLCRIDKGKVRFISRNGRDWTEKFPTLAAAAAELPIDNAILDGEVVVIERDGTTSFQALQNAFQSGSESTFLYYAFDLLHLDGYDLRPAPIEERKETLRMLMPAEGPFHYGDHVIGSGSEFLAEAARLHLEGIVSKRLGRPYSPGRSLDWLKVKCSLREEFVIGGFTKPGGSRRYFGALLLGYYDRKHRLIYAGRVGTGFGERTLAELHGRLTELVQEKSPFADLSGNTGQARGVAWVKPSLVAQIEFSNWTNERQLRHPSFQGLREDKPAKEVVRDDPISLPAIESTKKAAAMSKRKSASRPAAGKQSGARGSAVSSVEAEVAGVRLSHPDKVLYPNAGVTKLDLAQYYERIAEWMLPHVENRLLALVRCPGGRKSNCFFQKHPGDGVFEHFRQFPVTEKHKTENYLSIDDLAGLVSLVQMGVLEIHIWGSQVDDIEKPDRLIFDLDPDPAVEWAEVVAAAKEVRSLLEELELVSFVKTTGGKGLHIVVPVRRRSDWADAKSFCRAVADFLVAAAPDRYIATMSKAARKGKIFIDYLRNDRGATSIAPYSTRARDGATVSVPIAWEELSGRMKSDHFNIHNLPARLSRLKTDPWAEIVSVKQSIKASMARSLKSVRAGV